MKFYALKKKPVRGDNTVILICHASTENMFKKNVHRAFYNSAGLRPKGDGMYTLADFLKGYDQVIVTIEPVSIIDDGTKWSEQL